MNKSACESTTAKREFGRNALPIDISHLHILGDTHRQFDHGINTIYHTIQRQYPLPCSITRSSVIIPMVEVVLERLERCRHDLH